MSWRLASVAVPAPLRKRFDYHVPPDLCEQIVPGLRVRIPFGKRHLVGVVTSLPRDAGADDPRTYKSIEAVLDVHPLVPEELLALCNFAASYYQHPLGEVLAATLPGPLRRGQTVRIHVATELRITVRGREALAKLPARATRLRKLLSQLADAPAPRTEFSGPVLTRALRENWIEEAPLTSHRAEPIEDAPALTAEQREVLRGLQQQTAGFSVSLLDGVTGSGKTEIYLRRVGELIASGAQALVLAPEIGLTPQLLERFRRRFGASVAGYHSGMSEGERAQVWLRARAGELSVVIGTRSAVFVPFARLGLIVVDEEHDVSYKQQDSLRYSARDLAIWRARNAGVPVILGSATPSLESLYAAKRERYAHLRLRRRVGAEAPPAIRVLDVRSRPLEGGLSQPLLAAIALHLEAGGQVLLFLNRRGYAPALLCRDCGWTAPCKRCDARLSLHRYGQRLICHHCGAQAAPPTRCPSCESEDLAPLGQGTERIEQTLREHFPKRRIERLDSDRLRRAGELDRLLKDIRGGEVNILVGTQVLAKGHDFAGLSLVGIVSVDQALYGTDFRALERMGQLVTQVAGRAGRSSANVAPAEVILQTREPAHPTLRRLLAQGYAGLSDSILEERRAALLPPFSHLALLRAESATQSVALEFLSEARALLPATDRQLRIGAPVPAPMERRAGRYRAQLLLQSLSRAALQKQLAAWIGKIEDLRSARRVRWSIDVDPADLF